MNLKIRGLALVCFATFASVASAQYTSKIVSSGTTEWTVGRGRGNLFVGGKSGFPAHAIVWDVNANTQTNIHPSGWSRSVASDVAGGQIVGYGRRAGFTRDRGILWTNNATTAVDLTPTPLAASSFSTSSLNGTDGVTQVGEAGPTVFSTQPYMWKGTADSAVNLTPATYTGGWAMAVAGNYQVGTATTSTKTHAFLWNNTADSATSLHPSGYTGSQAVGLFGDKQVGGATNADGDRAFLWTGTAASGLSLHPAGWLQSFAAGVNATHQVGYVLDSDYRTHAARWSGNAASFVNLETYLTGLTFGGSPVTITSSLVTSIDPSGRIYGVAYDASYNTYAVVWDPVPEPSTMLILGPAAIALCRKRKRSNS